MRCLILYAGLRRTGSGSSICLPGRTAHSKGKGDALFYGDTLLAGYRQRSDASVYRALAETLQRPVLPLELADTRWYHLDTCLIPVAPDLLAYYPPAFDSYANTVLESLPGDKILLTEHDALRFGGNAVVVGSHVVMNSECDALAEALDTRGYTGARDRPLRVPQVRRLG